MGAQGYTLEQIAQLRRVASGGKSVNVVRTTASSRKGECLSPITLILEFQV
jgi:hypothetical protein